MRITLLAAAAAASLSLQPAAAAIVTIETGGLVDFGLDSLGLFGPAGQSLRGAVYEMDFSFDISNAIDAGNSRQANGGTSFGRPSPVVQADLTINGVTLSFIDPYRASYARFLYPASSQLDVSTGGPNGINGGFFSWSRADQGIPLALDAPAERTFGAGDTVFSVFQRANPELTVFTYLQLRPLTIEIATATAAVPEPGSWAMMIAGFGLIGAAARRRTSHLARSNHA